MRMAELGTIEEEMHESGKTEQEKEIHTTSVENLSLSLATEKEASKETFTKSEPGASLSLERVCTTVLRLSQKRRSIQPMCRT